MNVNDADQGRGVTRCTVAAAVLISVLCLLAGCGDSSSGQGGPSAKPSPSASSPAAKGPAGDPGFSADASAPLKFPTPDDVGVPDGWEPVRTVTGDFPIEKDGAVIEDLRVENGTVIVRADNVTIRRVELVNSAIRNEWDRCYNGLVVEDSTFRGDRLPHGSDAPIWPGGYTARRVLVEELPEGPRASGVPEGCEYVRIEDSYISARAPKEKCEEWHGDAFQGYYGPKIELRQVVLILDGDPATGCAGTAPFFYPDQGNTEAVIDGLVVEGGSYSFRLGTPATIKDLYVVRDAWHYGPLDVKCDLVTSWDAHLTTLGPDGQPADVETLPCDNEIR
jgi:hypothetical protein